VRAVPLSDGGIAAITSMKMMIEHTWPAMDLKKAVGLTML